MANTGTSIPDQRSLGVVDSLVPFVSPAILIRFPQLCQKKSFGLFCPLGSLPFCFSVFRVPGLAGDAQAGTLAPVNMAQMDTCARKKLEGQIVPIHYCSTNSKFSPSNRPLSLILRLGMTSSAINEISMNGAFNVLPISRDILLSRS